MAWSDWREKRWQEQRPPQLLDWSLVSRRINKKPRPVERFKTGIDSFDRLMGGGLPYGMTLLLGAAGTGKSLMAKTIARKVGESGRKVFYFFGEDSADAPYNPPYLNTVDMVSWKPGVDKAIKTVETIVDREKPDLIVLDSMTTILSQTSRAVPESEVREYTKKLAADLSGILPVLATSEVRGAGAWRQPAGGQGVRHASIATLELSKKLNETKWDAEANGGEIGDVVWFVLAEDRDGQAKQGSLHRITYLDGEMLIE